MAEDDSPILLTGWTGNTAAVVMRLLRQQMPERRIVGISHSLPDRKNKPDIIVTADLDDAQAVEEVFREHRFRLVLHVANIRFTPLILRLADAYAVEHTICVHTTGMYSRFRRYSNVYQEIETAITETPPRQTAVTILRPTLIYGVTDETRDHNMHKLARYLSSCRWFPLIGSGKGAMQPVYMEDVAAAIIACIGNPVCQGKAYEISGGSILTFTEVVSAICQELGRRPLLIPVPGSIAIPLVAAYERLTPTPRITVEQVLRLQEDKTFSHEAAARDLGFRPRPFSEGIRAEIATMRALGLLPAPP